MPCCIREVRAVSPSFLKASTRHRSDAVHLQLHGQPDAFEAKWSHRTFPSGSPAGKVSASSREKEAVGSLTGISARWLKSHGKQWTQFRMQAMAQDSTTGPMGSMLNLSLSPLARPLNCRFRTVDTDPLWNQQLRSCWSSGRAQKPQYRCPQEASASPSRGRL